jgi:hypothetical protein
MTLDDLKTSKGLVNCIFSILLAIYYILFTIYILKIIVTQNQIYDTTEEKKS